MEKFPLKIVVVGFSFSQSVCLFCVLILNNALRQCNDKKKCEFFVGIHEFAVCAIYFCMRDAKTFKMCASINFSSDNLIMFIYL